MNYNFEVIPNSVPNELKVKNFLNLFNDNSNLAVRAKIANICNKLNVEFDWKIFLLGEKQTENFSDDLVSPFIAIGSCFIIYGDKTFDFNKPDISKMKLLTLDSNLKITNNFVGIFFEPKLESNFIFCLKDYKSKDYTNLMSKIVLISKALTNNSNSATKKNSINSNKIALLILALLTFIAFVVVSINKTNSIPEGTMNTDKIMDLASYTFDDTYEWGFEHPTDNSYIYKFMRQNNDYSIYIYKNKATGRYVFPINDKYSKKTSYKYIVSMEDPEGAVIYYIIDMKNPEKNNVLYINRTDGNTYGRYHIDGDKNKMKWSRKMTTKYYYNNFSKSLDNYSYYFSY